MNNIMFSDLVLDTKITIASHYEHTWYILYIYDPEFAQYAVTIAGKARFVALFTDRSDNRTQLFGKLHSINDEPSNAPRHGKYWHYGGLLHRINGPAAKDSNGIMEYCINGKLHRDGDLPAFIGVNGYRIWYINGKRHRENGPACIYPDGSVEYWINDIRTISPR